MLIEAVISSIVLGAVDGASVLKSAECLLVPLRLTCVCLLVSLGEQITWLLFSELETLMRTQLLQVVSPVTESEGY